MRILFLDDDEVRIDRVKTFFPDADITIVRTAKEAVKELDSQKFDVISLDHDLGGDVYTPSDENSGYEVARWLKANRQQQAQIIIHSWNIVASESMETYLSSSYIVYRALFGSKQWMLIMDALIGETE